MSTENSLAIVVLAAGKGTRMNSVRAKVLHEVAGLSMVAHVRRVAESLNPEKIILVIGPDMDDVQNAITPHACVVQKDQKGTADAVKTALPELKDFSGDVLVLYGDVPLIRKSALEEFLSHHRGGNFGASVLAMAPPDPSGYGRIVQNPDGSLKEIIEERDTSEEEQLIRMVNSGVMVMDGAKLSGWLEKIEAHNVQGEFYLTDLPKIVQEEGGACGVIRSDWQDLQGINSRAQLAIVEAIAQDRLRRQAMEDGVTLQDPGSVFFAYDTKLGQDVVVGANVVFGPGVEVANNVIIHAFSHLEDVKIASGAEIGPFARLRRGAVLQENVKIGNFVEVKNAEMGKASKANHLSYIGDASVGEGSNIGAGTITCNYDGFEKNKTDIGSGVFVGSNSALVAPVSIGDGAIIAAGSTITNDIPANALGIARTPAEINEGWATTYRAEKQKKKSA